MLDDKFLSIGRLLYNGGIDGFSRRIVHLHASSNNSADTVLKLFYGASILACYIAPHVIVHVRNVWCCTYWCYT